MSDLGQSIVDVIKKRTSSVAFGTYIFFWATYHWQGLYTTFFVSSEQIATKFHGMLKNEYVNQYFFGRNGWNDLSWWAGLLVPLLLTYIFIYWPLPQYVLIKIYRREQEHKTERFKIKIAEEQKRKEYETESVRSGTALQAQQITAKTNLARKRKTAAKTDPKILWDEEYQELKRSGSMTALRDVLGAVYEHQGQVRSVGGTVYVDGSSLRVADTRGLITIIDNGRMIQLTEKGKYFASKYPN